MSRLQTPIRRNDTVIVTTGKDSGKRGRVLKVIPVKNRLIVEGIHIIKRHTRPNPQRNIKGGIVEPEGALHASNVQLVCPECGKMTRVGHDGRGGRTGGAGGQRAARLPRVRKDDSSRARRAWRSQGEDLPQM